MKIQRPSSSVSKVSIYHAQGRWVWSSESNKLGKIAHSYKPSTGKMEIGRSRVQSHPQKHRVWGQAWDWWDFVQNKGKIKIKIRLVPWNDSTKIPGFIVEEWETKGSQRLFSSVIWFILLILGTMKSYLVYLVLSFFSASRIFWKLSLCFLNA